jgi:hypothetical protein
VDRTSEPARLVNAFVGVVQAFQKIPFLHTLAPTRSEPPFLVAQALLLVLFVLIAIFSLKRFHPSPIAPAPTVG